MKIECDKCGAKYSIADDKVRGKTFKIRCKKCSNVIIVRDKAGGGDAAESEAPSDEPGWHLAIGGETVGPLTEQEVREKHAAGEIDRETSVWQEGFEDWLPLGDVGTFSDLADRAGAGAAAAAPDPFASGGDDDYSSSNRGAASAFSTPEPAARPAAVSAAPVASVSPTASSGGGGGKPAAADSPRVSALTSARNENSVLFSLDSLSSMAMGSKGSGGGGGGASAPSSFSGGGGGGGGGGGHSPSASGNSEGSGLIDIRSMGAMLGGGGGGGGGGGDDDRDDSMLPSFGGTGFGGLAAAPLLTAAPPVASDAGATPEPQRQDQTPLYILIGILVLGLGGLAAYVVTRPTPQPQEKIVERIVAPPVQPDKKDSDDDDDDKKAKKKKKDDEAAAAEADAAGDAAGDKKATPVPKPGDKKGAVKPGDKKGAVKPGDKKGEPGDKPATTPEPAKAETKAKEDDTPSVECLLDPSKCKKGGGGEKTKPPPDASMPEKLELADIKTGVGGPKASAESNCKKHAKGGEKVKIKLSISGPAGTVLSSSAEDDAGNPALGSVVAAELKKATFKKVQKEQIGTVVSVSF